MIDGIMHRTPTLTTDESAERVTTGLAELDEVLHGGYPRKHCILVCGTTGTGKTTLALHFLMASQARGEPALYMSMAQNRESLIAIASSHGWDIDPQLNHILDIEDFMPDSQAADAHLFQPDLAELNQTCATIIERVKELGARSVILDTLSEMRLLATDQLRFRRAMYNLKTSIGHLGIPLLLISDNLNDADPIPNLADTIVRLEHQPIDFGQDHRRLRVQKMRASSFVEGFHDLRIERSGLRVFPRVVPRAERYLAPQAAVSEKFATGDPALDALLGGGLERGARILAYGPTGVGKSTLGYQLALTAAARGERSVIWSFEDLPHLIRVRLGEMSDRQDLLKAIRLHHMEQRMMPPGEFVRTLTDEIKREDLRLVVLDSIHGLGQAMGSPVNDTNHIQDLMTFLTANDIMVYITLPHAGPSSGQEQERTLSLMADTILSLQYTRDGDTIGRCVSVIKQRSGPHHTAVHAFALSNEGLHLGRQLRDISGLMPGQPRHAVEDART